MIVHLSINDSIHSEVNDNRCQFVAVKMQIIITILYDTFIDMTSLDEICFSYFFFKIRDIQWFFNHMKVYQLIYSSPITQTYSNARI